MDIQPNLNCIEAARALGMKPSTYWRDVVAPALADPSTPVHTSRTLRKRAAIDVPDIIPTKTEMAMFEEITKLSSPATATAATAPGLRFFSRALRKQYGVDMEYVAIRMLRYLEQRLEQNPRPPHGLPHPVPAYLALIVPGRITDATLRRLRPTHPRTLGTGTGTAPIPVFRVAAAARAAAEQAAPPRRKLFATTRAERRAAATALHATLLQERLTYVVEQGHSVTLKGLAEFVGRQAAAAQGMDPAALPKLPPSLRPNPAALIQYVAAEMRQTLDHHDPKLFALLMEQARAVAALLPDNPVANATRDALLAA